MYSMVLIVCVCLWLLSMEYIDFSTNLGWAFVHAF